LRAEGRSYEKIAVELGVAKGTVVRWSKQYKEEVMQIESDSLDELLEELKLTKEARVRRFSELLSKLETVLEKEDLKDVAPDRLLRLWLRTMESLRAEVEAERSELDVRVQSTADNYRAILEQVAEAVPTVEPAGKYFRSGCRK
jgi:hypothetical protein